MASVTTGIVEMKFSTRGTVGGRVLAYEGSIPNPEPGSFRAFLSLLADLLVETIGKLDHVLIVGTNHRPIRARCVPAFGRICIASHAYANINTSLTALIDRNLNGLYHGGMIDIAGQSI